MSGGLLFAPPAVAAPAVLVVSAFTDGDANAACDDDRVTTQASPATLRNALCVASNQGDATVQVPAGEYRLTELGTLGPLTLGTTAGSTLLVESTGGAAEIIGDGTAQLLILDESMSGGISVTIDGLSFEGGVDAAYGGGAIIGGSAEQPDRDELVLRNTTFRDNASTAGSAAPGGAVQFIGGTLTIEDSVFEANTAGTAAGGAVYYEAFGTPADQSFTITGSAFRDNTVTAAGGLANGGGAVAYDAKGAAVEISGSTFTGNRVTTSDHSPALGGAVRQQSGPATITASTFTGNAVQGGSAGGAAIEAEGGAVTAQYNRIAGNTGAAALSADASSAVTATLNWWGCNLGPTSAPCDLAAIATGTSSPYLKLSAVASPAAVNSGSTSQLTGSLLVDSAGAGVPAAELSAFQGVSAGWTASGPAGSTVSPASVTIANGLVSGVFTAGATGGSGGAALGLDAASVPVAIDVTAIPAFTSPDELVATIGLPIDFDVTAVGSPAPVISRVSGTLPNGLVFTAGPDGSAKITGTATDAAGEYPIGLRAENGATATQTLVISVGAVPSFSGSTTPTLGIRQAADVTITAVGDPAPAIELASGSLPAGLTLTDQLDGTAKLGGTPTASGAFPVELRAVNRFGATVTSYTITVTAPPGITSSDRASFTADGTEQSFPITFSPGYPAATEAPALSGAPAWLSLTTDGGTRLVGTPPRSAGGTHEFVISLSNPAGTTTQVFTLTVVAAPAYAGPTGYSVAAGAPIDETIAFAGSPTPGVTAIDDSALPAGITASDLGGGRVRLQGTATAAAAGSYLLGIDVANSAGSLHQDIGLVIGLAPSVTSAATTTFTVGSAGSLPITVVGGYPVAGPVAFGGTVPAWLSLSGPAGAQQLVGTPPAGAGGTVEFDLVVSNAFGTDRQAFRLVVNETPAVTQDPADASAVAGTALGFTAAASGFPAPSVQWQRSGDRGASWQPIAGATAGTLTLTATLGDDGARYRAVFTNAAGQATSAEATLAVGEVPEFAAHSDVTVLPGAARSIDVSVAGHPAAAITASGLPAWLTLTDHGDGTATLSGTPALGDAATSAIELVATNAYGSDVLEFSLTVDDEVALPSQLPATVHGVLGGVPAELRRGQTVTVSGAGFLPGAPIALGVYSTLTPLGSAVADGAGAFSAEVTIPETLAAGEHALAASGVGADGSARVIAAETTLVVPASVPGDGGNGSMPGGLSRTGVETLLPMLLAAGGILAGLALLVLLAVRRRRSA
ncbi:immunoglobulin domain-containing protein [Agromyces mediolanus]|uniref:immunoglobulin domain-containing protein n=1 Tax=Agromyces mediolanus TaxID=41986 RepID=UPI00203F4615|nr:immunoglobulin domain-containing protein [Agromyces mediolanus]MCM3657523.1 immunoglobulin domain-containing protein [Agromyces mediolanus]